MKATALIAALILAAAAGAASAQTSPPTDDMKTDKTTAPLPPTADQARRDVANQKQDPLAMQTSSAQDWNALSGHDKGYVTRSDALPNSWLAANFAICDENQDQKVTETEYTKCQKKQHK